MPAEKVAMCSASARKEITCFRATSCSVLSDSIDWGGFMQVQEKMKSLMFDWQETTTKNLAEEWGGSASGDLRSALRPIYEPLSASTSPQVPDI